MSEQRIHTGAEAATAADADEGDGHGLQHVGSHGDMLTGGDTGLTAPGADTAEAQDTPDTEGGRYLAETQNAAGERTDREGGLSAS